MTEEPASTRAVDTPLRGDKGRHSSVARAEMRGSSLGTDRRIVWRLVGEVFHIHRRRRSRK